MIENNKINRNSTFELLRLLAMFFIVVYHLVLHNFSENPECSSKMLTTCCMPMHIGVPLFVLISGFFTIHFSVRGFFRLISQILVLGLGLRVLYWINTPPPVDLILNDFSL